MNLIFLCAAKNKPVGGIKVIHQLAETADGILSPQGGGAYLCHPNRPNFRTTWFTHKVRYRSARFGLRLRPKIGFSSIPRGCFDPTQDVVVLPELWVRKYALQLQALGVPYIILVQAGYFIGKGNPTDLRLAYAAASAVWCVSDDTMECVRLAYPEASDRLHRFHVAVVADRFRPLTPKENWITYIPGKMPRHAELLRLFADPHLPPGWQWKPLHGLTETEMAETLGRSRIFVALAVSSLVTTLKADGNSGSRLSLRRYRKAISCALRARLPRRLLHFQTLSTKRTPLTLGSALPEHTPTRRCWLT
jgi:hypothetical protein